MDRRRELLSVKKKINTFTVKTSYGSHTSQYQFDDGMTWEEWVNSDYNDFYVISEGNVRTKVGYYLKLNGNYVMSTDIIFNTIYVLDNSSAGGQ